MKILITGAAGFIGSHVTDALLERGDEVTAIDNFNTYYSQKSRRSNIKDIAKSKKLLGYSPKTSIEQGIRKFVEWYKNQPYS